MSTKYILSIDQGTTSSRVVVLDENSHLVELFSHEFEQIYHEDAVLQDAEGIYQGVLGLLNHAIHKYKKENIQAIGITNQRETTVCFRKNGKPITYSISWQSKHTKEICDTWKALGYEPVIRKITGLQLNPYFSASKMRYFLDDDDVKPYIENNDALFGTMDTYLLYRLTKGRSFLYGYDQCLKNHVI